MRVIEVLGPGCQKCQYVERLVREIAMTGGVDAEIRHVTDVAEIVARGVLATPGIVVDGRLVSAGRVPTREQVEAWLGVG
ncbi:MAG TPA: thioredoxin family protein [Candidatus Limnocylindrales bacterium]|nr:thioredoxin family protein [Candidatus Limnocylindrales bacterium]